MNVGEATQEVVVGERRPIKARGTRWAQRLTASLVAAGATPNSISIAGMVAGILAGACFGLTRWFDYDDLGWRVLLVFGAAFVQLRLLANMFDGMVAVASGRVSATGELYNELPDRVSDAATLIGFGCSLVVIEPTLGYLAALVAVFVAYVRAQGKAAGAKHEFCGPMAKQHRMFVITLAAMLYALLPVGWTFMWWGPGYRWGIGEAALWIIILGGLVTAWRRLARIARTLRERSGHAA